MKHGLSFLSVILVAGLFLQCGSSTDLSGLAVNEIQLEGEHAEELNSDLAAALTAAGATLNQAGRPDLVGTVTWEWGGEGENPYPTLVRVFLQADPEEDGLTVTARYEVPTGAQPQDVAHYRSAIVDRIMSRLAAQTSPD